jgi:nitrogen fixation protein NifZ
MIDLREAKLQWGQPVVAAQDLYNDGSLPDVLEDLLLVAAGGPGEIVQVGHHSEANVPVYMVDFGVVVLGCLEEELALAPAAARPAATAPMAETLP